MTKFDKINAAFTQYCNSNYHDWQAGLDFDRAMREVRPVGIIWAGSRPGSIRFCYLKLDYLGRGRWVNATVTADSITIEPEIWTGKLRPGFAKFFKVLHEPARENSPQPTT